MSSRLIQQLMAIGLASMVATAEPDIPAAPPELDAEDRDRMAQIAADRARRARRHADALSRQRGALPDPGTVAAFYREQRLAAKRRSRALGHGV